MYKQNDVTDSPRDGGVHDSMTTEVAVNLAAQGFPTPERWASIAARYGFKSVQSVRLEACPSCAETKVTRWGQFVYYSTFCQLLACQRCGLIFSDRRIDSSVIQQHFESNYKNEAYFSDHRRAIFRHLVTLLQHLPEGASVLDIGGAKGHFLEHLRASRPDLSLTLNDISIEACAAAKAKGFETVLGGLPALEGLSVRYDAIVLSDVLYYEPEIARSWRVLDKLSGSLVVFRIPWKLPLIWLACQGQKFPSLHMDIRWFNPEHLYVLSPAYLTMRLHQLGFRHVTVRPSPLLGEGMTKDRWFRAAEWVARWTRQILTPSLIVTAER